MAKAGKNDRQLTPTAQRLRWLRAAEGDETATAFANKLGIAPQRYHNMEAGFPLSLEVALLIVQAVPGCSLDWLYNNVENGMTLDLRQRLNGVEKASTRPA